MGRFDSLALDDDQQHYRREIILNAELLEEAIMSGCDDNDERENALTRLEECVMWAVKSVSRSRS